MSHHRPRTATRRFAAAVAAFATAALVAGVGGPAATGLDAAAGADPAGHFDPPERTTPLDVFGARFGQISSAELSLSLRTYEPWEPRQVSPSPKSGLCVWLRSDTASTPGGRLCVVPRARAESGVGLRYTALDHDGRRIGIRDLGSDVRRPRPTTISTRFAPAQLRLVPGLYYWHVRSVSGGVEDRLPNIGELPLEIALSTAPAAHARCFGAASRDPRHTCDNRRLHRAVVPTPDEAVTSPNSPCTPLEVSELVGPCEFGLPAADARFTVALVGDSHASHWRAALENVAKRKRWRGISITRTGCPLSRVEPTLEPESRRLDCLRWNREVPTWFERHPDVHTVFVVGHFAADIVNSDGRDELAAKADGYAAAWDALPKSVTRIIVIRDTPLVGNDTFDCVRHAIAKDRNAGDSCAVARKKVLRTDAAVVAAHRLNSERVKVVDMSSFFCSTKRCYPVIGGALVYKDDQHITEIYASTLGPYLQRAIGHL